ncbi:hypothetical protein ACWEN3_41705, partial [Streptomyces sp. NPDC004561]
MRPRTTLSLGLATAAVLVPGVPGPAAAVAGADMTPSCAAPGAHAFPLTTRIHGGPASYVAGGGYGTWYIDLTNTTSRTCTDIHPVVVLFDDRRTLRADRAELDFYDGSRALPVTFENTDEQELVGVLDGPGFKGFTVPPGETVSVRVRLAVGPDTAPDQVTVNAAAVQRRGQDGEWAGESGAYRFAIGAEGEDVTPGPEPTGATPGPERTRGKDQVPGPAQSRGKEQVPDPVQTRGKDQVPDPAQTRDAGGVPVGVSGTPGATPSVRTTAGPSLPFAAEAQEAGERAHELARTGLGLTHGLLAAAAAL